jgi:hypothetical protein
MKKQRRYSDELHKNNRPSAKEVEVVDTAFNEELFYMEKPLPINPMDNKKN